MKTLFAIPVAMLGLSIVLAGQPAAAAPQRTSEVRVVFAYNPADTAKEIYSDFRSKVRRACQFTSIRSLAAHKHELTCMKTLLDQGVAKMQRPDIAALHNGVYAGGDTRG